MDTQRTIGPAKIVDLALVLIFYGFNIKMYQIYHLLGLVASSLLEHT